jgi:hypothetical protein
MAICPMRARVELSCVFIAVYLREKIS